MKNMNKSDRMICIERAQNVLDCLKNCNSGADIHKVNSMRHIASSIMNICDECEYLDLRDIAPILMRLERNLTLYFKDKFGYFNMDHNDKSDRKHLRSDEDEV